MVTPSMQTKGGSHLEGLMLKAMIERRTPRPIDIARAAGVSRQYVCDVLAGRKRASAKFVGACRELGLPVDLIWGAGK